ncbi:MAG: hypothetical protein ABSD44_11455 [Terracidiphilus sp.]
MLIEVGVLSLALAASSQRCGVGQRVFSLTSGGNITIAATGLKEPSLLYSASLEDALALDFGLISDIRHVLVERANHNLLVWIALDNPTKENREKVFQKQFDLIEGFPEISFDFNLVSSGNRPHNAFATDAKLIYSRKDK